MRNLIVIQERRKMFDTSAIGKHAIYKGEVVCNYDAHDAHSDCLTLDAHVKIIGISHDLRTVFVVHATPHPGDAVFHLPIEKIEIQ